MGKIAPPVLAFGVLFVLGMALPASAQANGLLGEYYHNATPATGASPPPPPGSPATTTFVGAPYFTRIDATVDVDWGNGSFNPADAAAQVDDFMTAWTGFLTSTVTGAHSFQTNSDDGVRLWVNGTLVIDAWIDQAPTDVTGAVTVNLTAGTRVPIRLEYYENGGGAVARLRWDTTGGATFVVIPTTALTVPDPPTTPVLTMNGVTINPFTGAPQINLSWTAATSTASGAVIRYEVFRGGASIATGIAATNYSDATIAYNVNYCYTVRAVDRGLIFGNQSNQVCATATPPPPRTNDHEEGLIDGKCSCGSVAGVPVGAAWPLALAALGLVSLRRRR